MTFYSDWWWYCSWQVANNCTSFAMHNEFLLITTHSHSCRSVSRLSNVSGLVFYWFVDLFVLECIWSQIRTILGVCNQHNKVNINVIVNMNCWLWCITKLAVVHYLGVFSLQSLSAYNTHTHSRLTALCPGLPGWASTRKVKPIWILLKQEIVSGSGISWAVCKSALCSRQITMPAPHHSSFLQAGCPSCRSTNSVKALKAGISL